MDSIWALRLQLLPLRQLCLQACGDGDGPLSPLSHQERAGGKSLLGKQQAVMQRMKETPLAAEEKGYRAAPFGGSLWQEPESC